MADMTYAVTIHDAGNVTSDADNIHTILTTPDHILPPARVTVADTGYNGYANRETWTFCLWAGNDQDTYNYARELAGKYAPNHDDMALGELVVTALEDLLLEAQWEGTQALRDPRSSERERRMLADPAHDANVALGDIGSTWRIDRQEVGAWARELVAGE